MTDDQWGSVVCPRCAVRFETLDAYDAHVVGCVRVASWSVPKYKPIDPGLAPKFSEGQFGESTFNERDRANWAGETQADRIDSGLRSGRIRSVSWEAETESVWRRIWRRLKGAGNGNG